MPPKLDSCVAGFVNEPRNKQRWPDPKVLKQKAFAVCNAALNMADNSHLGFIIDLSEVELSETEPSWIQMFPVDKYMHPKYGELDFTKEKLQQFADNINKGVREQQLDIDFEHKEGPRGGKAAGWIVKAEAREDGLYGFIDWTKTAREEILNKEWKYFSPEFLWEWEDSKGSKFQNVVLGGALTNRPFMKNIAPVNLSEYADELEVPREEEVNNLDPKELRESLGLKEDASDDDVKAKIKALSESATLSEESSKKLRSTLKLSETATDDEVVNKVVELRDGGDEARAKKLEEAGFKEDAKLLRETAKTLAEMQTGTKLDEWSSGNMQNDKGEKVLRGLPPALHDKVKELRLDLSTEDVKRFDELVDNIVTVGLTDLREVPSDADPNKLSEGGSPQEKFSSEVKKFREDTKNQKDGKAPSLQESAHAVRLAQPGLWKDVQNATRKTA